MLWQFSPWASGSPVTSGELKLTGFSLAVPTGATIDSITARVLRLWRADEYHVQVCRTLSTKLVVAGVTQSADRAGHTDWTQDATWESASGTPTQWGDAGLTVAEANASDFGFAIRVEGFAASPEPNINSSIAYISDADLTVAYTTAAGVSTTVVQRVVSHSRAALRIDVPSGGVCNLLHGYGGVALRRFVAAIEDRALGLSAKVEPVGGELWFVGLADTAPVSSGVLSLTNGIGIAGGSLYAGTLKAVVAKDGVITLSDLGTMPGGDFVLGLRALLGGSRVLYWLDGRRTAHPLLDLPTAMLTLAIGVSAGTASARLDILRLFAAQNAEPPGFR